MRGGQLDPQLCWQRLDEQVKPGGQQREPQDVNDDVQRRLRSGRQAPLLLEQVAVWSGPAQNEGSEASLQEQVVPVQFI